MYRVEWEPVASNQFAAITMTHLDRWSDINAADNDIDDMLKRDPLHFSQPVSEGLRRIICEPLAVYFFIENDLITVQGVGWIAS